jgi:hypothetical protein
VLDRAEEYVTFDDVTSLRQTAKALLVDIDGAETWIPQSVISEDSEIYKADQTGTLIVAHWWAKKAGLVDE